MGARAGHGAGFWFILAGFTVCMAFSTIPTPLYAIYQQRDGFPTFMVTIIFGAYAVGVALTLYLAGHVSDWLGRRRIVLVAIAAELVSAVIFLLWPEVPGLIVARLVSGAGIGVLTATATAYLAELRAVSKPGRSTAVLASLANIGGLALGPLIAGILAEFAPLPLVLPYAVFIVLLVVAGVITALTPETVDARPRRYSPQKLAIPAQARSEFFAAGAGVFAAFAVFGMFTALSPTILAQSMGETSRLAAGLVTFAVFASASIAQVLTVRLGARIQLLLALGMMVGGVLLLAVGVLVDSLPVFVASGVVAGAGVGVLFRASLGVAGALAPEGRRGEVLATTFLIAYIGLAVPALLIGLALALLPLTPVLVVFAAVILLLVLWATPRMIARAAR